jgi:uncharacterized protein YxjI
MITIDQLLESVDLDFEPRWVTKDIDGSVLIWDSKTKPVVVTENRQWEHPLDEGWEYFGAIKLSEFANTHWTKCIYEVPRKPTRKIYRFDSTSAVDAIYDSDPEKFKKFLCVEIVCKLNKVIDAVNELKGAKNE